MAETNEITVLLREMEAGREGAMDRLMAVVYEDLEHVAAKHLGQRFGRGAPGVTLEPAALVNESWMKLIRQRSAYDNRGHFFAIATKVMLRVLTDYQRSRGAACRGGDRERVTLSFADPGRGTPEPDHPPEIPIDALVTALERLEALDERKADVVKLRVIWGLEMKEIASTLDVSLATVERDWSFAKAWLSRETEDAAAG